MQKGRKNSAVRTREAAAAAQTSTSTTSLLGNVPLGPVLLGTLLVVMLL